LSLEPARDEQAEIRQHAPQMADRTGHEPGLESLGGAAARGVHGCSRYRPPRLMSAVKTTTKELGESRVRVDVEVTADALQRELDGAASEIGRDMKVPGFRKGKVPSQVVLQQVGREAVLDEAVRRGLPGWYEEALADAGITAVGDPHVDLSDLPEQGSPLAFTIEVGIVPDAKLGDYKGLEVGRREPHIDPGEVSAELERLRETLASLEAVEREAAKGDFVVVDFTGTIDGESFEGGEARGQLVELGTGQLVAGFEEQLERTKAGDHREVTVTFPADYPAEQLAGREVAFSVEVKEVKEKRLPELDDDFAVEAGGYDSLDELRAEIGERLTSAEESAIEAEFRQAAVDAVVARSKIDIPPELVHEKAHEMWHRTARRLSAQGLDPARFLEVSGKSEEELVTDAEPEAELALKREAVLAAIVEAEGIEVGDDEVEETLRRAAGSEASDKQVKRALKRARSQGADEAVKEDIALRKAVDLVVEHAKPIPAAKAEARERLWTPDKESEAGSGQIWTPGST
jgi:trigger factor